MLNRPQQHAHMVGLCYATPGEFAKLPTDYRVGLTMYEASDPREKYPHWTWQINEVDLLLTPSDWCKQMWERASVYTPIKVIELSASHHFLEAELWKPHDRKEFVVVSWATMTPRKSPAEMIYVFKQAFPRRKYPHCRFKIKTRANLCGSIEHDFPKLDDDRVEIINQDWTAEQMVEFARSADVAMFLSKGEGSGRPGREAMALGLPCVIADNTGYHSICKPRYVTPIRTHHTERSPLGGEWYVPDWDQSVEMLRWHYDSRKEAAEMAGNGAEWYRREHSLERICTGILEAMRNVTDKPSKQSERQKQTWGGFYPVASTKDIRHIQEHHKRFFEYVTGAFTKGARLLEIGIGTGAFYEELARRGYTMTALEKDKGVIDSARASLKQVNVFPDIRAGDTFNLKGHKDKADMVYHQGLFEHFSDADILRMIREQFKVAPRVVFSVPSAYYPTRDFGNERLMTIEDWRRIVGQFRIVHSEYYGGDGRFHVLVDLSSESPIRGVGVRRL